MSSSHLFLGLPVRMAGRKTRVVTYRNVFPQKFTFIILSRINYQFCVWNFTLFITELTNYRLPGFYVPGINKLILFSDHCTNTASDALNDMATSQAELFNSVMNHKCPTDGSAPDQTPTTTRDGRKHRATNLGSSTGKRATEQSSNNRESSVSTEQ